MAKFFSQSAIFFLRFFAVCCFFVRMDSQVAQNGGLGAVAEGLPMWAEGLPGEVVSAVLDEAARLGVTPAELVASWVVEAAQELVASERPEGGAR
jgi:hypothetical protein